MTETSSTLFASKQFFGSFFHQDWELEAADTHGAVGNFLALNMPTSDHLRMLVAGIDDLIASNQEPELPAVLDALGSDVYIPPPGTYASWLTEIATQLRQAAFEK